MTAVQAVITLVVPRVEPVVADLSEDAVFTAIAAHSVVPASAADDVVSTLTVDRIVTTAPNDHVVLRSANEVVRSSRAGEGRDVAVAVGY